MHNIFAIICVCYIQKNEQFYDYFVLLVWSFIHFHQFKKNKKTKKNLTQYRVKFQAATLQLPPH